MAAIAAFIVSAGRPVAAMAPGQGEPPPALRRHDLVNRCWTHTTAGSGRWPISTVTLCFRRTGRIDGFDFAGGHGADLTGHWRITGRGRLSTRNGWLPHGAEAVICTARIDRTGGTLILADCGAAGVWHADPKATERRFGPPRRPPGPASLGRP